VPAHVCIVFTVPLLSMATPCVDENNILRKSTAFLGMGQFFSCCSPFNYNLVINRWSRTYQIGKDFLMSDTSKKQAVREYMLVAYVFEMPLPLLPKYSTLVGGAPGSRSFPTISQREETQREHEDGGKASRERTVYGEEWYNHNDS
jgi:hypothetical protein